MAIAFIGLGSNLGRRQTNLEQAVAALKTLPLTHLLQLSGWIETEPMGGSPQGNYLNGVAQLRTALSPHKLLEHLQKIEVALGRPERHDRWGPRVIDLDLLTYDDLALETPKLTVPHSRMHKRAFVLIPLSELAPEWKHPRLGQTAVELLRAHSKANLQGHFEGRRPIGHFEGAKPLGHFDPPQHFGGEKSRLETSPSRFARGRSDVSDANPPQHS